MASHVTADFSVIGFAFDMFTVSDFFSADRAELFFRSTADTDFFFDSGIDFKNEIGIFGSPHHVGISKTLAKKIRNYSRYEESTNSFEISAFLIAQFGKNFTLDNPSDISGTELMGTVLMILRQIQTMIGGSVVFLECEHEPKLVSFYQNEQNNFHMYGIMYPRN